MIVSGKMLTKFENDKLGSKFKEVLTYYNKLVYHYYLIFVFFIIISNVAIFLSLWFISLNKINFLVVVLFVSFFIIGIFYLVKKGMLKFL